MAAEERSVAVRRQREAPAGLLFVYAALSALSLWLVSSYVVVPLAFPQVINSLSRGLVAGMLFLGMVSGAFLVAIGKARFEGN